MVSDLTHFWQGKSVFITGAAGFKGSWLSHWLTMLGANVSGVSLYPGGKHCLFKALKLSSSMAFSEHDICDLNTLKQLMNAANPDVVFHLAAQPLVLDSYSEPVSTFASNVMGTVNVLEACRTIPNLGSVIVVTSDKCYKVKSDDTFFDESCELGGNDPYSASKACAEIVTNAYLKSFFEIDRPKCALSTVRAGNVIGGGDWSKDRIMTDIMSAAYESCDLVIRNPSAVRPWQHVLEPLYGYLILAQRQYLEPERYQGAWNFAPPLSHCQNVDWIVSLCKELCSNRFNVEYGQEYRQETKKLTVNAQKAMKLLNWEVSWSIEETIEKTVSWYDGFYSKACVKSLCEQQINQFTELKGKCE